jgi:methyl-accepting chemotaxis protein
MTIRKGLSIFAALTIAGLLAIVATTTIALNQLRIGSNSYRIIVDAKDLTADILPPPMYVIEAYLEAKLAAEDPATLTDRKAKLQQLETDFNTRRDFWRQSALPDSLRDSLVQNASEPALGFWREINQNLLPAIARGERTGITESMHKLDDLYAEHRKAIDKVVTWLRISSPALKPPQTRRAPGGPGRSTSLQPWFLPS